MWKKFLAMMATVATVATLTTFSVPVSAAGNYIQNATATPDRVSATGSYSELTIDIVKANRLTVKILDSNDVVMVTLADDIPVVPMNDLSYTFYGTVDNTPTGAVLDDGEYKAKFVAYDSLDGSYDTEYAYVSVDFEAPVVTDFYANPTSFSQEDSFTTIYFTLDDDAYITATIEQAGTPVRTFTASPADYDGGNVITGGAHSFVWDGKKNDGTKVADGVYTVKLATESLSGLTADYTITVTAEENPPIFGSGNIKNLKLDPTDEWDPSIDDPIEITYDLEQDATSLKVYAIKGSEKIEIDDEGSADKGEYDSDWDGIDDNDEYIASGTWYIQVEAIIDTKKYAEKEDVKVVYELPSLGTLYVTKDSFDPDQDETSSVFFQAGSDGVVTVTVYEGTHKIVELADEEDVEEDKWYSFEWNGEDDDDDIVDESTYKFVVTLANAEDENLNAEKSINVDVEEDEESSDKKTNIVNDEVLPTILNADEDDQLTFSFCIDEDAEKVNIGLYEGTSSSGTADIVLADDEDFEAGCHDIDYTWTGRDDDNKKLDEDSVYAYEIEAKKADSGSGTSTEKGKFAVGDNGNDTPDCVGDNCHKPPYEGDCTKYYTDMFNLDARDSELCTAIAWVTEAGIFNGYPDRTFRPYSVIQRDESVKVILNAFDATILPADGSQQGFSDVNPYGWYMPFVRTAVFYGMLEGYPDGTARLANPVNRAEMLKLALEASRAFVGLDVYGYSNAYTDVDPAAWYAKYVGAAYTYGLYDTRTYGGGNYLDPSKGVERGEVALMLYRMNKEGILEK